MKTIRTADFLALLTLTASLFAAPQIAVYQNWDNVQISENSQIEYGETPINTPVSRLFRIENKGNQPLTVSINLGADLFSIIQQPTSPVPAGGSTTFRVRLYGDRPTAQYGYITINSNDPANPAFDFRVHGTIIGPFLSLLQNWSVLPQEQGSTFDFGTIAAGTVTSRAWRVYNAGNRDLFIHTPSAIVSGNGFVEIDEPRSYLIPNDYSILRVRFAPAQPNTTYNGTITIYSNDPPRNPYVVYLTGRSQ